MSQKLSSFYSRAPSYQQNRDPYDTQVQLLVHPKVKQSQGFWYQNSNQKAWIERNISTSIHKHLPFPCLPDCINFAGIPVTQYDALLKSEIEEEEPCEGATSWIAGYTLVLKNSVQHWRPSGSWQLIPTIHTEEVTCLGYRPNPNFLPYKNWFDSALFSLSFKTNTATANHIISFLEWRNIKLSEADIVGGYKLTPDPALADPLVYPDPLLHRTFASAGEVESNKLLFLQIKERKRKKRELAAASIERRQRIRLKQEKFERDFATQPHYTDPDPLPQGPHWQLNLLRSVGNREEYLKHPYIIRYKRIQKSLKQAREAEQLKKAAKDLEK